MNPLFNLIAGPIFDVVGKLIDRLIPDPAAAAQAKLEMIKMQKDAEMAYLQSDTSLALAQIDTNKEDAKGNWFQSGWRPMVGYVSIIALAWNFIGYPMAVWYAKWYYPTFTPPPMIDTSQLFVLLTGMLGIGTMRSFEKFKGVAK